ncbi:putative vacuolar ATP synthase subunit E [Tilletiopsis washingtonensis]|uniref:Putative vacuolar ATP synthase subunit E n=1 Tax=Tilletiopsis washingtonensis TaxID=58919 RepID=A0A316ZE39_9BASI|nr:putative vacuolar ATP synthase subunit E [Tilletiopsis washingtonensis]PWO00038.1 putative vacuolar ATP synthase subunit E [Tilletiopsis washingtonensis]
MSRALNDDEVLTEMKKMVAFIKQEAMEKAREIQVKADEEFAIEKAKIVRQEAISIDAAYEKKTKQAQVAQKIAASNQTNASRLKVLQSREAHLQELFEAARGRLEELSKDQSKYQELLTKLVLQGLLQLTEPKVEITARSGDVQMVQEAAKAAAKQYEEKSGRKVETNVKDGLSKDCAGGIMLAGHEGRIKINNTLDERLRLSEDRMLPEIGHDLFGPNPNRRFFN